MTTRKGETTEKLKQREEIKKHTLKATYLVIRQLDPVERFHFRLGLGDLELRQA